MPAPKLPDPRRYPQGEAHPLFELSEAALRQAIERLLAAREDAEIRDALARAPDRAMVARLWNALCAATEASAVGESVVTRVFAMPVVIVSGAREALEVPGVLARVEALAEILQRSGALGASRNFGLSNALCSLAALEALPASTIRDWSLSQATDAWTRAIAPEPIAVSAGEEAHLRFLLGAAITPADAPAIAETAAHIGAWGMEASRELGAQLAVAGAQLLALPRPPQGVIRAAYRGRRAQLEAALNLFLSNTIKRFRMAAGDPTLLITAHDCGARGAELRVSAGAPFDDTLLEGFRWPLHPLDDLDEIADGVRQFAADCRLHDVRIGAHTQQDR